MVQFIGTDPGRRRTKVVTSGDKKSFPSAVGEWRKCNLETERDFEVEINEVKYFVGDLAEESYFGREMTTESKIHLETKVLFLTSLALVAGEEELVITTGLPVNQHKQSIKLQLSNLLCGTHKVRINDGELKVLSISDIGIVPEGIGLYWDEVLSNHGTVHNEWLATQPLVRVLEVGSRTINLGTITYDPIEKKRRYLDKESDTLKYGYLALEAAGEINDKSLENFSRRVVADASKVWLTYNPMRDVVLLGGGGVITLGTWLRKFYPISLIARDPLFGNASGFNKMGMVRWQNNQKNLNRR
jgi:plasmid segregation protein ParM